MAQHETAEILALNMLTWMAGNEEAMNSFSLQSGMAIQDILDQTGNPKVLAELLAGVMDFMLGFEELLTQFCEDNELNPEEPAQLRRYLPGGDAPDWG
ncbi:hypothetical protein IMCC14465_17870 [alpha proteobacterium IMCC14465]|uniref:Uncharacterized protein n=1 Tax=alpha proteobacterium IMCC14465 TaxID=1220535 RepID=J9DXT4_9PROT|nr:hypothetical protein IMCC14465_17870 [alpha proteobacterium IMCC14465]